MFLTRKSGVLSVTAILALLSVFASAQPAGKLADKKALTLAAAKIIAGTGQIEAKKLNLRVVIAVVDDGGHLIYLQRMDGTQTGSIEVAIGKARTAAAFRRETRVFDDLVRTRPAISTIADAVFLEGGVPILVGEQVVGAVGVSGASSQQDVQVAEAGIAALEL